MGEVKETVKGTPKRGKKKTREDEWNLHQRISSMMDDVSDCVVKKEDDAYKEGDAEKAENIRKAGLLRAVHTLLSCSKRLLEDY